MEYWVEDFAMALWDTWSVISGVPLATFVFGFLVYILAYLFSANLIQRTTFHEDTVKNFAWIAFLLAGTGIVFLFSLFVVAPVQIYNGQKSKISDGTNEILRLNKIISEKPTPVKNAVLTFSKVLAQRANDWDAQVKPFKDKNLKGPENDFNSSFWVGFEQEFRDQLWEKEKLLIEHGQRSELLIQLISSGNLMNSYDQKTGQPHSPDDIRAIAGEFKRMARELSE